MAFNCGQAPPMMSSKMVASPAQPSSSHQRHRSHMASDATHSHFGDAYSIKTNNTSDTCTVSRYQDELEADYDQGATELYRCIENKDWDSALTRLEVAPIEARTWVSRREPGGARKTRWRLLPLHAVCIFRAPLALIEALIELFPLGSQMKDDQGMLPVHLACRNGASKGVVLTLLNSFPDSIGVRDRKKRSLEDLVEASNSSNKEAVLQSIHRFKTDFSDSVSGGSANNSIVTSSEQSAPVVRAPPVPAPASVAVATTLSVPVTTTPVIQELEVDYENRTQLFRMILKKDWKGVVQRAKSHPVEAATWIVTKGFNGNLRFLPIHKACVSQPPDDAIRALLDSYSDGALKTDQDGWLPVHCASFYGAGDTIINELLKSNPKGAQCKDDEGRLPLHYACLKGASQGVVEVLLASFSRGAMIKDDEGRLPVHHACSKGAPESVIDALIKASPKGAQSKDDQGRLPLHHACRKNASERIVRTLLRVYPRAAQIKDDQDKLPLHYACQHMASSNVVGFLLTTYPESIHVENGFGYTPLAEAKAVAGDSPQKMEAVIAVLEKFKKEQDKIKANTSENWALESKVTVLEDRVRSMELTIGRMALLGKDMKSALKKNKEPSSVLDSFAEDLIDLAENISKNGSVGNKTPLKSRQSVTTPIKSMFSRGKSNKTKK